MSCLCKTILYEFFIIFFWKGGREMKRLFLTIVLSLMLAGMANAGIVALHQDDNDPTTEGWDKWRDVDLLQTGPITNSMGLDAWKVDDDGGSDGGYKVDLTAQELADAPANGWTLSTTFRTPNGNHGQPNDSMIVGVNFGGSAFIMSFGSENNVPIVGFVAGSISPVTLTGLDDGWHTYELIYDPVAGSADLFVDGDEKISNYTGESHGFMNGIVGFGSAGGGATGNGYYNLVEFEVVPEPVTLSLLGIGGLMIMRRKRS